MVESIRKINNKQTNKEIRRYVKDSLLYETKTTKAFRIAIFCFKLFSPLDTWQIEV